MTHEEIRNRLDDYVDGNLTDTETNELEVHLRTCVECAGEVRELRSLLHATSSLPAEIDPGEDLWTGISAKLQARDSKVIPFPTSFRSKDSEVQYRGRAQSISMAFRFAAAFLVAFGSFLYMTQTNQRACMATRLQGEATLGTGRLNETSVLRPGEWLETGVDSRAEVTVANIGRVELGPQTKLRVLNTSREEHRLELANGRMKARVWSPPRLFIVETPSATAVDLGCSYELTVDSSGAGKLYVTSGEVSLEYKGEQSLVIAGYVCETKTGLGPGTPYSSKAADGFRAALAAYDFENGGTAALQEILSLATTGDALTLWHLLSRVSVSEREQVYDILATVAKPPAAVTKAGILRLDKNMMDEWLDEISLVPFPIDRRLSAR